MKTFSLIALLIAHFIASSQPALQKNTSGKKTVITTPFSNREAVGVLVRTQNRLEAFVSLDSACMAENKALWETLIFDKAVMGIQFDDLDKRRQQTIELMDGYKKTQEQNKALRDANVVLMDDRDKWKKKAQRRGRVALWGIPTGVFVGVVGGLVLISTL